MSVISSLFYTWYTYNRQLRYLDEKKIFYDKKCIKKYAHAY